MAYKSECEFKQWNDKILKYDHNNIEQCSYSVQQLLHSASLFLHLHAAEQCRRNFLHLHRALIHLEEQLQLINSKQ